MNVLVTSASRKVWLVEAFKKALGESGQVFTADITYWAAAMHMADHSLIIPRSDSADFVKTLLSLCEEHNIKLVVPTRDEELPVLARAAKDFAGIGTRVHVSSTEAVETCLNKLAFHKFCVEHGFSVPPNVTEPSVENLPLFVRPRQGNASAGTWLVETVQDLAALRQQWPTIKDTVIVNQFVDAPEFTVDVFLASDGVAVSAVPRERMQVVAGESYIGRTIEDAPLAAESIRLCQTLGLTGHNTVQAFRFDQGLSFIEVNTRFGGGAALSFAAGAPSPRWLVQEALNEPLKPVPGSYRSGLAMLRYTSDVWVDETDLPQ